MEIAFRVDASTRIGTGHVIRCLALANALRHRGGKCNFIHRLNNGHMAGVIRDHGYPVHELPSAGNSPAILSSGDYGSWLGVTQGKDASDTADIICNADVDWLVVDHYALDAEWESLLKPYARRIAVIDDLANRPHESDLLLDQTHGRTPHSYHDLVPDRCEVLTGAHMALLREDFARERAHKSGHRKKRGNGIGRILICMGGSDQENVTATALEGVRRAALDADIDIMIGSDAPHLQTLRQNVSCLPHVHLHISTTDVPQLMSNADIAIGTCGTTSWERCCMGLPTLAMSVAENQNQILEALSSAGAVASLGHLRPGLEDVIAESLVSFNDAPEQLYEMSLAASRICDGKGSDRVAECMLAKGV